MDYEDILNYIEDIVEEIDFEEISVVDIQTKLQELIIKMEDNRGMGGRKFLCRCYPKSR